VAYRREGGIYCIRHTDGRSYVGSAVSFTRRWYSHRRELNRGTHHSKKLQHAWTKYGSEAFSFIILEAVEDRANLLVREQFWIDHLKSASRSGLNMCPNSRSQLGMRHSEDAKRRIGEKGLGRKMSAESRRKLSDSKKGIRPSAATIEKMRIRMLGHIRSPESRAGGGL
jgi:group I intron endonuclease